MEIFRTVPVKIFVKNWQWCCESC